MDGSTSTSRRTLYEGLPHRGLVADAGRRVRWFPTGNVRTISAANFLTGLYQNVVNVVLQRFVLDVGRSLTLVGFVQAIGGGLGPRPALGPPFGRPPPGPPLPPRPP